MKGSHPQPDPLEAADPADAAILKDLGSPGEGHPPFSLPHLVALGTFDLELAAWVVHHVSRGASYIIGAGPSGVGKSTTMRALLSFVPGRLPLHIALPGNVDGTNGTARCVISHELSGHPPPKYLWNQDLRDFFALSQKGHMLVGNMHADSLEEAGAQIREANGVPDPHFRAVRLFAFLRVEGAEPVAGRVKDPSARRAFREIHYSDGEGPHRVVYADGKGLSPEAPRDPAHEGRCREFLERLLPAPHRTVEETRRLFLAWEKRSARAS